MVKQKLRSPSPDGTEIPFRAMECPFCNPSVARIFLSGDQVFGLWDAYPVSPGHALRIPRRHIPTWFEATSEEHVALLNAIDQAKATIEKNHQPDGYNVGINCGAAAGQTVFHLHVHHWRCWAARRGLSRLGRSRQRGRLGVRAWRRITGVRVDRRRYRWTTYRAMAKHSVARVTE